MNIIFSFDEFVWQAWSVTRTINLSLFVNILEINEGWKWKDYRPFLCKFFVIILELWKMGITQAELRDLNFNQIKFDNILTDLKVPTWFLQYFSLTMFYALTSPDSQIIFVFARVGHIK